MKKSFSKKIAAPLAALSLSLAALSFSSCVIRAPENGEPARTISVSCTR